MTLSRRAFLTSTVAASMIVGATTRAHQATPAATSGAASRLASMLQYVPGGKLDGELNVVWNDYVTQVAAIEQFNPEESSGISRDELAMMGVYASVPDLAMYATMLPDLTGYAFGDIGQALTFGAPPNTGLILEVDTDTDTLIEFWESMGYEERENDYGSFWTIGEEAEINISNDIQRSLMARVNNVAFLDDGVLAYSATSALLGEIQAVATGDSPNIQAEFDAILASIPAETTSTLILSGEVLALETAWVTAMLAPEQIEMIEETIATANESVGDMPVTRTVCIGVTAGGSMNPKLNNPESQEFMLLELDGADQADQADQAADVIAWRAENMNSLIINTAYSEIVPDLSVEAVSGEVVQCTLPLTNPGSVFAKMVMNRDILLFAY